MKSLLARLLYCVVLYLAVPIVWLRLWRRSRIQPEYWQHKAERWGYYPALAGDNTRPLIWVHAVSVGETRAAQPLIAALLAGWPKHRILLTGMTPTGRETGQSLFAAEIAAGQLVQAYLPYDYPGAVRRFFRHFQPAFGVLMETELWPNLLHASCQQGVPVFLANARLSARSARGYQRFSALTRPAFAALTAVAAQTEDDASRLRACGAREVTVCGNLKFDVTPAPDKLAQGDAWRAAILHACTRPVWLAASTRDGENKGEPEEVTVLAAFARWRQALPDCNPLLVLVPRHPQRFDAVAHLIEAAGLPYKRRSQLAQAGLPDASTQVWLGDSMGEMVAYYRLAEVSFIGGSLLPLGGQNLIEAAACGCPVLVGPHTFNFTQATADALAAGAALRVADGQALADRLIALTQQPEHSATMRQAACAFAAAHQGATGRMLAVISSCLTTARITVNRQ